MLVFGARDDCGALDVLATESTFQWLDTEKRVNLNRRRKKNKIHQDQYSISIYVIRFLMKALLFDTFLSNLFIFCSQNQFIEAFFHLLLFLPKSL